jgi:Coenzyme PQQ synthesis protein D (PqqD)
MRLDPLTVVVRSSEPLSAAVDDELVMLDLAQSRYFGLDAVGRRIWALIEEPTAVGALCTRLQGEFDVAGEKCRADVLAFLERMRDEGLVDVR